MKIKCMKSQCDQCLFSNNKIVSEERSQELLMECFNKDTHFNCHKTNFICAGFIKTNFNQSQLLQIAERLNILEFI